MQIPIDAAQSETAAQRRHDAERLGRIGENLLRRGQIVEAATAFEQAESLAPGDFQHFPGLAYCYLQLKRPEAALRVCDRGSEVMPNGSDL